MTKKQIGPSKKVGAPRSVSLSPEDMVKLGEEMCEWVALHKPIHLSMWYTMEKDITDGDWNSYRQCPEFLHYYNKALKMVGYNYLTKDSIVDHKVKDRWQRVYFKDLKQEEDETARYMQSLKLEEIEKMSPEIIDKFNSLMGLMRKNQQDNIDLTSSNTETKS